VPFDALNLAGHVGDDQTCVDENRDRVARAVGASMWAVMDAVHGADIAVVTGPNGKLEVPVEITDAIRPGVVSLPHGWGHSAPGTRLSVAATHPGVNVNSLLDSSLLEPLSGTSVLNGVPVEVTAAG
jgi:hypothetical protein